MRRLKHQLDRFFEDYFGFSRAEINGFYFLSLFMISALLIRIFVLYGQIQDQKWEMEISSLNPYDNSDLGAKGSIEMDDEVIEKTNTYYSIPSSFDPNRVSKEDLLEMGLPADLAERWINYLSKGGSFKNPEDIKKLYGLKNEDYDRLLPSISIASSSPKPNLKKEKPVASWVQKTQSLNEADTSDLKSVRGIGSYYARQIVEYRERLGGFIAMEQLFEIYRMDTAKVDAIAEKFRVEKNPVISKIKINTIEPEEFIRHPYVGYTNGKIIMSYREVHGPFKELADLGLIKQVDQEKIKKLSPYLDFSG